MFSFPVSIPSTTFTTAGANGQTAGIGVTSISEFLVGAALQLPFGGTAGDGTPACLETGYDAHGNPGPPQTGVPPSGDPTGATGPAFTPAGQTTALPSVSPLTFPSAAYVLLSNGTSVAQAPAIGTATAASSTSVTVNWTAPSVTNGSAVTGYVVTPYTGEIPGTPQTFPSTATTETVTGLTSGNTYSFTVAAINGSGTGPASSGTNTVTLTGATAPGAPTIGTATAGNASATLTWTAPSSDGGSPITGYVVTPFIGATAQATQTFNSTATSEDVTGLTNGTTYTFEVAAINSAGTGPNSAASNAVTPVSTPGAPTIGAATGGDGSATVNWTAPGSDGGSAITGYVITPTPACGACTGLTTGADSSSSSITGLTNGTSYTFTVAATNAVGTGTASAASNAVTPATIPGAPTIGKATAADGSASVTWSAGSDGGSPITGYTVTTFQGATNLGTTDVGAVTSTTIKGLTDGTTYTFTVAATNAVGTGPASAQSNAVTPEKASPGHINGYWLVTSDGGVFSNGAAPLFGSASSIVLNSPIVGMVPTPDGKGYWLVASDGGVFAYGDATYEGSMGGIALNSPIVGIASTPDGKGYWLVGSDGGVFAFGDARYHGSMGGTVLNEPVVGIASDGAGGGYWLVGSDGGVFAFGGAGYFGSTGGMSLNAPVVAMAAAPGGNGYWLVGSDGGVFAYGGAPYDGSAGGTSLSAPIVGISANVSGGYVLVGADGGAYAYGTAFYGSQATTMLTSPVVGAAS